MKVPSGPLNIINIKTKMAFNINKHALVPKHSKASETEKNKVLEMYGVTIKELPKILKDDPAITDFDVKSGDLIKIERPSKTSGTAIYYRVVI